MLSLGTVAALVVLGIQSAPIDGTWRLTRIFRSGPAAARRAVPIDSTVYLRLTLESHRGGWISGWLNRRYHGVPERSKVEAGPLRGSARYLIGAELDPAAAPNAPTARASTGTVAYRAQRLAMAYQGADFPPSPSDSSVYALLVVDDSTQRAQGVLLYEGRRPPQTYPQLGTVTGSDKSIPLYGVRVDWASVSNPRCPLLGAAAAPPR